MSLKPTPVVLRNGDPAAVTGRIKLDGFRVQGFRRLKAAFCHPLEAHELWTGDGHWREDGGEHPLDIVKIVTPDGNQITAEGAFT
ncbi:MAG TPA: hypothetical protein VGG34_01345 [Opitutaceae bacterium]|jgi:hypothetical protein